MSEKVNIQGYLDYMQTPWGKLFYKLAWHNIECEGKRILDFGSGFGYTANHFAKCNEVVAVEPNEEILAHRYNDNNYEQILGDINALKDMPDKSFDVIICHNVMEYMSEREALLAEFRRLLTPNGFVSIIKHNKAGKIMQKAVFEYNIDEALLLLDDGDVESANFGTINEYDNHDLEKYCKGAFTIHKIYGLRIFYGLQRNEVKSGEDWLSKMYDIECKAEEIAEFRDVAFFQHIILM